MALSGATDEVEQLLTRALKKHLDAANTSAAKKVVLAEVQALAPMVAEVASWQEALAGDVTVCEKKECTATLQEACSAFVKANRLGSSQVSAVKEAWQKFESFQAAFSYEGFMERGISELEACLRSAETHGHVSDLMQVLGSMEARQ